MTTQENRKPKTIGISISDSPDMKVLGLGNGHLREAMTEVATYVLSSGDDLAYGGDLRVNGFTWTLFELASRYTRRPDMGISRTGRDQVLDGDSLHHERSNIFISHSHTDQEFVDELDEQLRRGSQLFCLARSYPYEER